MSTAKRAYVGAMNRLCKRMKRPISIVCDIMSSGFTDGDFVNKFKECFAGLWQELVDKKGEYDEMDRGRLRRHFKPIYHFAPPGEFLLGVARCHIARTRKHHLLGEVKSEEERGAIYRKYRAKSLVSMTKREHHEKEVRNSLQMAEPEFSNYFIKTYFDIKRNHPEDVDSRMRILEEAAKFKCAATISFMRKVNSAERNFTLRHFAFETLQKRFGFPAVHLHRNRKGKRHLGDDLKPSLINTPKALVSAIYESQYNLEAHKVFHVFLSHSLHDQDRLLKLKVLLNSLNLTVYLDWTEDRLPLRRKLTNADTAKVIMERIKNSQSLMYVLTPASLSSAWASWELGYAHALGKKICVLKIEEVPENPAFLDLYDQAEICGETVVVHSNGVQKPLGAWLSV